MATKKGDVGQRAWRILRLELLWARKGGVFRRRLVELRVVPKFLKSLAHSTNTTCTSSRPHFFYGERQLSFDNTPLFHFKMHRPASLRFNLPCITPQVDFDYDFDLPAEDHPRLSFLNDKEEQEITEEFDNSAEENGIDSRAEEFIAKFYEQMKLQRQISYLQYHDRLNSTTN